VQCCVGFLSYFNIIGPVHVRKRVCCVVVDKFWIFENFFDMPVGLLCARMVDCLDKQVVKYCMWLVLHCIQERSSSAPMLLLLDRRDICCMKKMLLLQLAASLETQCNVEQFWKNWWLDKSKSCSSSFNSINGSDSNVDTKIFVNVLMIFYKWW